MECLALALGPENPAFGSWNWLGVDLAQAFSEHHRVAVFRERIPTADAVVFFKFLPDRPTLELVSRDAAIVYCPVDVYGSAAEIDADALRLRLCGRIIVHCRRLQRYFSSYAPTTVLDHHLKYTIPIRSGFRTDGPLLWIGERSNLSPVAEWVNRHDLPGKIIVVTNLSGPSSPEALGFLPRNDVQVEAWSPENHRTWLDRCRAAFDVKGEDFRARHKPAAKAMDYLSSGIPLAMNAPSSSVEALRERGFEIPDPGDSERWLSIEYARTCQQIAPMLRQELSLDSLTAQWEAILEDVVRCHRTTKSVVSMCERMS